ncbi:hypothetical protein Micbo1qcDRAFT_160857, partial [Microdochium bolleyi]
MPGHHLLWSFLPSPWPARELSLALSSFSPPTSPNRPAAASRSTHQPSLHLHLSLLGNAHASSRQDVSFFVVQLALPVVV